MLVSEREDCSLPLQELLLLGLWQLQLFDDSVILFEEIVDSLLLAELLQKLFELFYFGLGEGQMLFFQTGFV